MKDQLGDRPYGDLFGNRPPPPRPQPDGKSLKEEGLGLVKVNAGDWFGKALMIIAGLPRGWVGLPEDWREIIVETIGHPHHHNAWGSLTSTARKHGLVALTGVRRPMQDPTSKARMTDEYRRT